MTVTIRRLTDPTAAEREALAQLLIATVADGASVGFLPPLTHAEAATYWAAVPDAHTILLVAERDGGLVGTVQALLATRPNARHRAEVARLLVDPAARRQGIGRLLMQAIEAEARSAGRWLLVLDTRANDPSNSLYRSVGFTEAGRIPSYALSATGEYEATTLYFRRLDGPDDQHPGTLPMAVPRQGRSGAL